jgi:hypothetical protein
VSEQRPQLTSYGNATRDPDDNTGNRGDGPLAGYRGSQLSFGKAKRLQQGQVAPASPDRSSEGERKSGDGPDREADRARITGVDPMGLCSLGTSGRRTGYASRRRSSPWRSRRPAAPRSDSHPSDGRRWPGSGTRRHEGPGSCPSGPVSSHRLKLHGRSLVHLTGIVEVVSCTWLRRTTTPSFGVNRPASHRRQDAPPKSTSLVAAAPAVRPGAVW